MLNNVNIYFGKVVNISDEEKLYRCQVSIDGYTDQIDIEKLPWYFHWYGLNYLPLLNDIVPVIIFDNNFATGFYGKKVNVAGDNIDDGDYENYLEIFKREIDGSNVELTYTVSKGIMFTNKDTTVNLTVDDLQLLVGGWGITVTDKKIDLGTGGEASLLGDKTVEQLHAIVKHQSNVITEMIKMMTAIAGAANGNPLTLPIGIALTPLVSAATPKLIQENLTIDLKLDMLQSKKTFIE